MSEYRDKCDILTRELEQLRKEKVETMRSKQNRFSLMAPLTMSAVKHL